MAKELTVFTALEYSCVPAFLVRDELVVCRTAGNQVPLPEVGQPVADFLGDQYPTYAARRQSSTLHLGVSKGELFVQITVLPTEDGDLFLLRRSDSEETTELLSAAVRGLLPAVHTIHESGSVLFPLLEESENPEFQRHTANITHAYFETLRAVSLLTSYHKMSTGAPAMRTRTELLSVLRALFSRAADALQDCGITLEWSVPQGNLFAFVELQELTGSFLELISNAAKHPGDSRILRLQVTALRDRLQLVIHNDAPMHRAALASAFQFRSDADPSAGFGIGLAAVQLTARRHGGTALLESDAAGTTVTMTLRTDLEDSTLASPTTTIPELYDPVLVGLADVLPASTYDSRNVDL